MRALIYRRIYLHTTIIAYTPMHTGRRADQNLGGRVGENCDTTWPTLYYICCPVRDFVWLPDFHLPRRNWTDRRTTK